MKHNKFTKATSIVMSAVVSAMAVGQSACATQPEKSIATQVTDLVKATSSKEWAMFGAGAVITGVVLLGGLATYNHFTTSDTLKLLNDRVVTIKKDGKDIRLLVLRIQNYTDKTNKTKPALLVLCDNDDFAQNPMPAEKSSDKKTVDEERTVADEPAPLHLNAILPDTAQTRDQIQEWINSVNQTYKVDLKVTNVPSLRSGVLNYDDLTDAVARCIFVTINSFASVTPKASADDKKGDEEATSDLPTKFVIKGKINYDLDVTSMTKTCATAAWVADSTDTDNKMLVLGCLVATAGTHIAQNDEVSVIVTVEDPKSVQRNADSTEENPSYDVTLSADGKTVTLKGVKPAPKDDSPDSE